MRKSAKFTSIAILGGLIAGALAAGVLWSSGSVVRAQTPPAPCSCSRSTPIVGADEVTVVPGQLAPRYGIIHCLCGAATCVSQVAYGSVGIPQLYCVK
jgi:hypothetical protein